VANSGTTVTLDSGTQTGWADNDFIVQAANSSVTDILDTSYLGTVVYTQVKEAKA
jgi:hypothetical protein